SFAEEYIEADNNTLKREASRVIGNIAALYADKLDGIVSKLLTNSGNEGTVVRWGSAYALGRIILIPQYAKSGLYGQLTAIAEAEQENGVKNQYLGGLKKAKKIRE
ncbi:MAG: HEAT repeat domain-containing protein, partial [Oscillospiraceae bacterium]|nr:HEAT repeat domain-containing protein [Oscillospiraceae bacterium]